MRKVIASFVRTTQIWLLKQIRRSVGNALVFRKHEIHASCRMVGLGAAIRHHTTKEKKKKET